jgi:D-beta-D-heptose 7-phosphate kinase/D-beta-D-heptose 1-phosphate adenosyltransferase
VILLSDYGKGAVTAGVIDACREAARASGGKLMVDSKARSFARYGAVDLIKPNAAELANAVDMPTNTDAEVEAALQKAMALWEAKAILVTRAAKGMSLAVRGEPIRHFPGRLARCSTSPGPATRPWRPGPCHGLRREHRADAIAFAHLSAGVAVGKVGTATVSPDELVEAC